MKQALKLILLVFTCFLPYAAHAERRIALVIGNGAYEHVIKLPNPANDAQAIADLLRGSGFEVIGGNNLRRDEMVRRVAQFSESVASGADAAVVFYAGHGVQISGKNYLIPTDADLRSAFDVKANAIDADDIIDGASAAKVKIVLLDACRDNPFAEQMAKGDAKTRGIANNSGLAAMQSGEGTMISFATSPNSTALDGADGHSPFTRALLDNLAVSGVEINETMRKVRAEVQEATNKQQLPWSNTNMTGSFYVTPAAAEPVAAPTPAAGLAPVVTLTDAQAIETAFWQSAVGSGQREAIQLYLAKYPKGKGLYSELAELRLAELDRKTNPPAPVTDGPVKGPASSPDIGALKAEEASKATEDALGLDAMHWRDLQSHLSGAGYSTGGVDGNVGDATRHALQNWQIAKGYFVSGYLNKDQMAALLAEPLMVHAAVAPSAPRTYRQPTHSAAHQQYGGGGPGNLLNSFGMGLGVVMGCKLAGRC
jgi:hypothetical protein